MQDRLQRFHMNVNQEIGFPIQLAIVPEIAISPSLELVLGPKGNGVTKSSLLLQLDHCSTRWVLLVVCRRSSCFSFRSWLVAWTLSLFLFIVFVCLLIQVVEALSTPAVADVESERWDSRLIGCFR